MALSIFIVKKCIVFMEVRIWNWGFKIFCSETKPDPVCRRATHGFTGNIDVKFSRKPSVRQWVPQRDGYSRVGILLIIFCDDLPPFLEILKMSRGEPFRFVKIIPPEFKSKNRILAPQTSKKTEPPKMDPIKL